MWGNPVKCNINATGNKRVVRRETRYRLKGGFKKGGRGLLPSPPTYLPPPKRAV